MSQPKLKIIDKNFGLSEAGFNQMVTALRKGNNQLYEKTFLAHFKSCMHYLQNRHNANHQDAYDATMDAYVLFCKRLREGKVRYGNISYLFTQIAVQHHYSWLKKGNKIDSIEGVDIAIIDPKRYDKDTREVLSKAWNTLGAKCRDLLRELYYEERSSKDLSVLTGRSDAAIRKQKQRCLDKLKTIFKNFDI